MFAGAGGEEEEENERRYSPAGTWNLSAYGNMFKLNDQIGFYCLIIQKWIGIRTPMYQDNNLLILYVSAV